MLQLRQNILALQLIFLHTSQRIVQTVDFIVEQLHDLKQAVFVDDLDLADLHHRFRDAPQQIVADRLSADAVQRREFFLVTRND